MTHSMCYHPDDENRWRSQRIAKRERNRSKKIMAHRRRMAMMQARMEMVKEIEELNHRREIKQHDALQAKKLAKVHKLRPQDMARPSRVTRKPDNVMDIKAPVMEDVMEARESNMGDELESECEYSVFTHNPLSECSYVNIQYLE